MHPNINGRQCEKPRQADRRGAAGEFDPDLYKRHGMAEAIFGAT